MEVIDNPVINEVGKVVTRPWGTYQTIMLNDGFQVKHITVNPGGSLSLQKHHQRAEHWTVVQGQLELTVDDKIIQASKDTNVYIPVGAVHRAVNHSNQVAAFVEVQVGDYLGEDDIVRLDDIYGRQ